MKVILKEKVNALGNVGEIVSVSPGYARNFLFPQGLALLADEGNKKFLDEQQKRLAKKIAAEKAVAEEIKGKINGAVVELTKRVGNDGRLFGTVTNSELAKILKDEKEVEIERRLITITTPIKTVGEFDIKVKLFKDVEADFKVKVAMDAKQVEEMKAKQAAAAKSKKAKKEEEAKTEETTEEAAETTEA